ncbi:MAG: YvcK family protein [Peptostreptococcus sp.]|uniref:gluconeogenesis factor YvcK family protein n=1 Tax=Peptostreptococcus sp. TaxID=1262 RepID=UPI002FCB46B4
MQIQISGVELVLSLLAFLGVVAFIVALYVSYKFLKLYRKTLRQSQMTFQKMEEKIFEPHVVVIGGGTGQSVFLRGLKHVTKNITAIVTVADDGGGSGALREDLGMLPPGDIRNCLLALANIEPTMNEVMQYRFPEGALKGQSFGNLFIAAMTGLYDNFETAVYKMSQIFAITGRVLPVTMDDINLVAELENGKVIKGESNIPTEAKKMDTKIKKMSLDKTDVKPLDEVISSIKNADTIVIGPGSLYTSILPNILMDDVVDALSTTKAPKIYVCNIMTQPGETDGKDVLDHVKVLIEHAGINFIDYVVANNERLPAGVFERYANDGAELVLLDDDQKDELNRMGITYVEQKLIEIKNGYIRHDAELVSNSVMKIAIKHSYTNNI